MFSKSYKEDAKFIFDLFFITEPFKRKQKSSLSYKFTSETIYIYIYIF